jgi:hypothetical protein
MNTSIDWDGGFDSATGDADSGFFSATALDAGI